MKELHQVVSASPLDDRRIRVVFENGVEGTFDCAPYMAEKYWRRLAEPSFFRLVRVECGTLAWPGDIDIDPEEIWEDSAKSIPPTPGPAADAVLRGLFAAEPAAQYDSNHSPGPSPAQ